MRIWYVKLKYTNHIGKNSLTQMNKTTFTNIQFGGSLEANYQRKCYLM